MASQKIIVAGFVNSGNLVALSKTKKRKLKQDIPFYLMLLPVLLLVFVFSYAPMAGLILAFKSDPPAGKAITNIFMAPWASHYGFGNFVRIFSLPDIRRAIWNTFYLNMLGLLISFPAPLLFALLLNEVTNKIFKRVNQTISYLPHFLSWISVTGLATSMLNETGIITQTWVKIFGSDPGFTKNENNFVPLYVFLTVWKNVGWGSIIFLASISSIDAQLYEAAKIDGAGRFRQCINITLPALMPTTMILLILNLGQLFGSNFDLVYGLKSPHFTQDVISTVVYEQGINAVRFAMNTALGFLQGLIALVLTLSANFISRKVSKMSLF